MLALLLVAASVGMSNFAAAVAIGVSGVNARTRLRVGLVFGVFETGMPVLGLLLGAQVAGDLGRAARWLGAGLLIGVGAYAVVNAIRGTRAAVRPASTVAPAGLGRLLFSGLALSMDNLVVGFALGTYHTSIAVDAITIGIVSVALSLIGLELGGRLSKLAGERGEQLAGLMLISVGVAIAAGALR
ncbi:MAG TPA: manganese efflux pump [Streptosporangiaceae bacterium]|jgi:putative Mn2+ efflux pump MntP